MKKAIVDAAFGARVGAGGRPRPPVGLGLGLGDRVVADEARQRVPKGGQPVRTGLLEADGPGVGPGPGGDAGLCQTCPRPVGDL